MIDLCKKYLPLGGARVQTPMSEEMLTKEMSLTTEQQKLELTKIPYRHVVGSLLWLVTGSRVDIAFEVTCCAKYSINPGMARWYALLRILRYLEGTKRYGLVYRRQPREVEFGWVLCREGTRLSVGSSQYLPKGENRTSEGSLHIYAHIGSDHARDVDTRRSVTHALSLGMVLYLLGNQRCNLL